MLVKHKYAAQKGCGVPILGDTQYQTDIKCHEQPTQDPDLSKWALTENSSGMPSKLSYFCESVKRFCFKATAEHALPA